MEAMVLKGVEVQGTERSCSGCACFGSPEERGHTCSHIYEGREIVLGGSRLQEWLS